MEKEKKKELTLISVIITTFNNEKHIQQAIESVFAQTYKPLEVIVVDGGSTDRTLDIVKSYGDRIKWDSNPNWFAAGARNRGFEMASADYFFILDGDDILYPDAIDTLYSNLPPSHHMIYGDYDIIDTTGNFVVRHISGKYDPRLLARQCFIHTGTLLLLRTTVEVVGKFDESLHIAEDIDYWCRMALAGCSVAYISKPMMKHRHHRESISARPRWKKDTVNVVNRYYDLFKKRFR